MRIGLEGLDNLVDLDLLAVTDSLCDDLRLPFHLAHQPARTRLLSFVTETLSATAERAFSRL